MFVKLSQGPRLARVTDQSSEPKGIP